MPETGNAERSGGDFVFEAQSLKPQHNRALVSNLSRKSVLPERGVPLTLSQEWSHSWDPAQPPVLRWVSSSVTMVRLTLARVFTNSPFIKLRSDRLTDVCGLLLGNRYQNGPRETGAPAGF